MNLRKQGNKVIRWYLKQRYKGIRRYMLHPYQTQKQWLAHLLNASKHTEWGRKYNFKTIKSLEDYRKAFPVQDYQDLFPFIDRMMHGEKDVLWSGQVKWFSKSSGTTTGRSKYIPVTTENLKTCHIKGSWDTMAIIYNNLPNAQQFEKKSLIMGGSLGSFDGYPKTLVGDISSIIIRYMPAIGRQYYTPDIETALIPDWEEKIETIAHILSKETDVVMIGGVPTWSIVLLERILEITGKSNMLDVWPDFQVYTHGGVSFEPYKNRFKELFPSDNINYVEIYNASEGFLGIQHDWDQDDMLLLLDNGIFYEFIPKSSWNSKDPETIGLKDVELGEEYALVITTNAGLWRYRISDTVIFTSRLPYKIKITGRVSQFINVFGEEVIVANSDEAISKTCQILGTQVNDYTVGPIYFSKGIKPGHQWLIDFRTPPSNLMLFAEILDKNLRSINSDYDAKRTNDMALQNLTINILPENTFQNWLRSKGKFGGQNKVPRLHNNRKFIEEILEFQERVFF